MAYRQTYPHLAEIDQLIADKLVGKQKHPFLPLWVFNYSPKAQFMPPSEWTPTLSDCRGLILTEHGEIVARPFKKFFNYDSVLHLIPNEPFTVWEKLDGSLLTACHYGGELVVSTRGSFVSEQAQWARNWFIKKHPTFIPEDLTYCFEVIFKENRIVVDYAGREECVLLSIRDDNGIDLWDAFDREDRFTKARRFDGVTDFSVVDTDPQFQGEEGFVVQWKSGFRAKIKNAEYRRLHRLITQVSTRSIWELLRADKDLQELVTRVPAEFETWVSKQVISLDEKFWTIYREAAATFEAAPVGTTTRKDFALYAKTYKYPSLLFSMLDGKDVTDSIWKIVEPPWSTPFRGGAE